MAMLTIRSPQPVAARHRGERFRRAALCIYAGLFLRLLYVPILLLVVLSFNDSNTIGLPFKGATLRWYREVLGSADMITSIIQQRDPRDRERSCRHGTGAPACSRLPGGFPLKGILMKMILLPILIPGIVGGISIS